MAVENSNRDTTSKCYPDEDSRHGRGTDGGKKAASTSDGAVMAAANQCLHAADASRRGGLGHRARPRDLPSALPLPRCLRQLVQPHRRSRRPDPIVGRWRRQRYWEAGLGRALGRTACS